MAKLVIMGAGVAGHTAASYASKWLGSEHEVIVVTPNSKWNYIPSNVWVGTGKMKAEQTLFELAPVYAKAGVTYKQAKAISINPEGNADGDKAFITIEYTGQGREGQHENVEYDFLINATGPHLNFAATEGLGPDAAGKTVSICTAEHATHAHAELQKCIAKMKSGEKQTLLLGVGHAGATCHGAAFEYTFNVEHLLQEEGVRDKAEVIYITNEQFVGDFGFAGINFGMGYAGLGYSINSKLFAESVYTERDVHWITGAGVHKVEEGKAYYELTDGSYHEQTFDFAMLIPQFTGQDIKAYNKEGEDITGELFAPNKFMKVDADYAKKPFEEWDVSDWPRFYGSPKYHNIFAAGIAFAPPHSISKPFTTPNGTSITAAPPRTGQPCGIIAHAVTKNICDMIEGRASKPMHEATMANMSVSCIASLNYGATKGTAVTMTVSPAIPNFKKYPGIGRNLRYTSGEIGLSGHWIKYTLHHMFLYKAKMLPGWTLIPE